jgi:hypothetical protein
MRGTASAAAPAVKSVRLVMALTRLSDDAARANHRRVHASTKPAE